MAWSEGLRNETIRAIEDGVFDYLFTGFLHLKNTDGRFGQITLNDVLARELKVSDKKTNEIYEYATAQALVDAGWAID